MEEKITVELGLALYFVDQGTHDKILALLDEVVRNNAAEYYGTRPTPAS